MKTDEYKKLLDESTGLQLIIAGLSMLVEDEGKSTREAFQILETTKRMTFSALMQIEGE